MPKTLEDLTPEEHDELRLFWIRKLNERAAQDMRMIRNREKLDDASAAEVYLMALAVAVSGIAYAGDMGNNEGEVILGNVYKYMLEHYHRAKAEIDGSHPAGRA